MAGAGDEVGGGGMSNEGSAINLKQFSSLTLKVIEIPSFFWCGYDLSHLLSLCNSWVIKSPASLLCSCSGSLDQIPHLLANSD